MANDNTTTNNKTQTHSSSKANCNNKCASLRAYRVYHLEIHSNTIIKQWPSACVPQFLSLALPYMPPSCFHYVIRSPPLVTSLVTLTALNVSPLRHLHRPLFDRKSSTLLSVSLSYACELTPDCDNNTSCAHLCMATFGMIACSSVLTNKIIHFLFCSTNKWW